MFLILNVMSFNQILADKAGVNAGVITVIWRMNIVMTAIGDKIIN